jgi:predicted GNAT family acetyltransferase
MLALVTETQPGPFGTRTIEFGGYIGLREEGRLVAMAGERLRCRGYAEVSAVCTLERHRGRGLGTALVRAVVHQIRARGEEAFLHASSSNETAIRLYRALGFRVRLEPEAFIVRVPE